MREIAKVLIFGGGAVLLIGLLIYVLGDRLKGFDGLPGDIRIRKPGFTLYVPITSMLVLSLVLSLISWLLRKFF